MNIKVLAAVAVGFATLATPALADFYIVREGPQGECRIVETKPTDTKIIVVRRFMKTCCRRSRMNKVIS